MRTAARYRFHRMVLLPVLVASCARTEGNGSTSGSAPYLGISYTIEGERIPLVDGVAETNAAAGSASNVRTRHVGFDLHKDLNADGRDDVAFILTQERGGSGKFYYVVAALQTDEGWVGSHAVLLGDRIAPRSITSGPGRSIIVHYSGRAPGEPMTAPPSRERSERLLIDDETLQFGVVAPDFEGEADPARMTLDMKPWTWLRTQHADGRVASPRQPERFTLTLQADGTFSSTTDCNRLWGRYVTRQDSIAFAEDMRTTRMHCDGSQEAMFTAVLRQARRYEFTSRGELVFYLAQDSSQAVFR